MTVEVKERKFEEAIECALLAGGPDPCPPSGVAEPKTDPYGFTPGGYRKRTPNDYDVGLCLDPQMVLDFIYVTQPKTWERFRQFYGDEVKQKFVNLLSKDIESRGTLDVLRNGFRNSGCAFQLAYFRPSSDLNEEIKELYRANQFSVIRQLQYSEKDENKSLDLGIFLNGLPIFSAELKNPLNGQDVQNAIRQYQNDRDPREPLFKFGRCLAHFAVDPDLVYVTTHLEGRRTRFLPFNQGKFGGAGNTPSATGYSTAYLWQTAWARDSVLELIQHFIHEFEEEIEGGGKRKKKVRRMIFPRYHQLDSVRRLVAHAKGHGAGERYLIQHSAGSGKSNSIAWLAHQLSVLHDDNDERVFDSIVVITDRRVLDRQLQNTIRQFEQTRGVVENIDKTSVQLKDALEQGKTIIVSTLQKYPVIADEVKEMPGKRFAVIIDEAHSSQSGESTKSLKAVLGDLEQAEKENSREEEEDIEDKVIAEIQKRGRQPNVSTFAFTATPKPKTLELFGTPDASGQAAPFSLYTMRQAIEEGFILDVLENYTTYQTCWKLHKTIEDDPSYDKSKAIYLLKSFVDLHPHAVAEKTAIMLAHFAEQVQDRIDGQAKAMIVTRSRLHAVRYKLAVDQLIEEKGYGFKALVAFSGTVNDTKAYTEAGMNRVPETQTAATFKQPEYRFLIVANKFQTGFDEPLLHTMYVDKKLGGVNAVQTLSRLNRVHPGKKETMVLDFANEAKDIKEGFDPYYEKTILSESTDPNLLYQFQRKLLSYHVFTDDDVNAFAAIYFSDTGTQDQLYQRLNPIVARCEELDSEEKHDLRSLLQKYARLYSFLSQIIPFRDTDLEKLHQFCRYLWRLIPGRPEGLPREIQQKIDMESYRVRPPRAGRIKLDRGTGRLKPPVVSPDGWQLVDEMEPLSQIIADLNDRFGIELTDDDRISVGRVLAKLEQDNALDASTRVNTRENVALTFKHKINDVFQDLIDSNFGLYKRFTDDPSFGEALRNALLDQYLIRHREIGELLKRGESMSLEYKSTLRFDLKEGRNNPTAITHACMKTVAAFLNTDGGDLLIGVDDSGTPLGLAADDFETDDKFLLHLMQIVRNALGDRAGTCVDPRIQVADAKSVCLVTCRRSPEPVFLKWKNTEELDEGDLFVRSGPGTVRLARQDAREYVATRFPRATYPTLSP